MAFNREQVVKSLEKWMKNYDGKVTNFVTLGNAIGLIEELIEENERLQDLVKEVQQYNEAWVEDNGKLRKEMKTLKADTVQNMQERLEDRIDQTINVFDFQISECNAIRQVLRGVKNDIYQIAKEVLEENNGIH